LVLEKQEWIIEGIYIRRIRWIKDIVEECIGDNKDRIIGRE